MSLTSLGRTGLDPFGEARRMQSQVDRLFGARRPIARAATPFPPVNLWAGTDSVAVTAELPGITVDDVDISVQEDVLTIKGERKSPAEDQGVEWHRHERTDGQFQRVIQLPFRVDPDQVQARFTNGVLEIDLKRPEEDKPRRIQIQG